MKWLLVKLLVSLKLFRLKLLRLKLLRLKLVGLFLFIFGITLAYSNNIGSPLASASAPIATNSSTVPSFISTPTPIPTPTTINQNNIGQIDKNANELLALKRQLEIEKARAELNKISGSAGNDGSSSFGGAQTTVSGVAINEDGRKIAWLQFADGGALTVDIGTRLDDYIVTNINLNGVTLTKIKDKEHGKRGAKNIFLRRTYSAQLKQKNENSSITNHPAFNPSPIITNANSDGANGVNGANGMGGMNEVVPPIVDDKNR
jgi:hypothetical protein